MAFEREPNNSMSSADNLGAILRTGSRFSRTISRDGSLPTGDVDFFRFLPGNQATSRLDISLSGLSGTAKVELYKDANFNRRVDAGELVESKTVRGSTNQTLRLEGIRDGAYHVAVRRSGFGSGNYKLDIKATPGEGRESFGNTNLGHIIAPRNFKGGVGSRDRDDIYEFRLDSTRDVNLSLRDPNFSNSDADLELYKDFNRNGRADSGEFVTASRRSGSANELISRRLTSGRYLARVVSRNGNLDYNISASAR